MFSTKECAWAQTSLKLFGRTIEGLKGFEFDKEIEKELIYAAGDEAIDITAGNKRVTGNLTVLKYEFDKLTDAAQAAGYDDITEVPHTAIVITCAFKTNPQTPIRTIVVTGVAFTKWTASQQQNAKFTDVPLPFIALKAKLLKG